MKQRGKGWVRTRGGGDQESRSHDLAIFPLTPYLFRSCKSLASNVVVEKSWISSVRFARNWGQSLDVVFFSRSRSEEAKSCDESHDSVF